MISVFFSYAHEDEALRDELEIHLSVLKRQNLISTWHDRRITAGSPLDDSVSEQLENADVILLLVSPYFLASDYCYDREMRRAIERHEAGEAIVIPVILQPCDWQQTPFGGLRATPTDGKPVSKHANHHDAFLEITNDIRDAAERLGKKDVEGATIAETNDAPPTTAPDIRSSNLRLKRVFSDKDRDDFLAESFEYIANFFENSFAELRARNPDIETRFERLDSRTFTVAIYVGGEKRTSCRIFRGDSAFSGDIAYSASDTSGSSSFNDSMRVTDDGYTLGLQPLGMAYLGGRKDEFLTPQGAAEYFWAVLISPLQ